MYGEWESEIDDQVAGIESLIQSQRLLLEQRLESKKIEAEVAALIDDRIKKLNAEYEQVTLTIDEQKKGIDTLLNLYEQLNNLKDTELDKALEIRKQILNQIDLVQDLNKNLMSNSVISGNLRAKFEEAGKALADATSPEEIVKAAREFERLKAQVQDVQNFAGDAQGAINSFASKLGLAGSAANNKTLGPMVKLFASLTQNATTFGSKLAAIGKGLGTMLGPLNLAVMFFGKLLDLMIGLDGAQANVAKSTGFMREQFDTMMIDNLTAENKELGIGFKEIEQATIGVAKTMGTMTQVNQKAAAGLVNLGAKMAKLGGTAAGTAKAVQKLNFLAGGGLVKGLDRAGKSFESIIHRGRQLGLTTAEMESGITQFGGSIAGMGGDVGTEFLKMATAAKNAGVEIGKLMTVTKKFQTFKDGADKAAELNSILGTSISSIEMMGKSGSERLEILRQSINASTGGFNAMDRFTQLAAAEIMGFGDNITDLAGFLNTGLNPAQQRAAEAAEKEAEIQKNQRKAILDTADAMTKIANKVDSLAMKLMPLEGAFTAFTNVVNGALFVLELLSLPLQGILMVLDAMYNNLYLVAGAFVIFEAILAISAFTTGGLAGAVMFASNSFIAMGLSAIINGAISLYKYIAAAVTGKGVSFSMAGGVKLLSAAFSTLGGRLMLVFGIFGLLYLLFGQKINPVFAAVFGFMAFGVGKLAMALTAMTGPATMAAFAIGLMAAGIALIFVGIGYVIDKFKELVVAVPQLAMQLPMMVSAFVQMVGAIGALGIQMGITAIMIGAALGLVALGFYAVGAAGMSASLGIMVGFFALLALAAVLALAGSSIGELTQLGEGVLKIGEGIAAFGAGLATMTGAVAGLMAATSGGKSLFVKSTSEGTTMIAGKTGGFFVVPPNINVDVKMPDTEMKTDVTVNVFIDGEEFRGMIYQEVIER